MTVNYATERLFKQLHSSLSHLIKYSFSIYKQILKQKLWSLLSKIYFTIDVWTSPNHKAFQAICTHFIKSNTKQLQKVLFVLPELQSHGGEEQAIQFLEIAENYKIFDQIGYFTGNNYGSNDKMCCFIVSGLRKQGIINWNPKHHQVYYQDHVINLAIQVFLFSKDKEAIKEAIWQAE